MEEEQGRETPAFTKQSMNNILQSIANNRRISPGYNNFRPVDEIPMDGNPYPAQPLAGKYARYSDTI